MIKRMTALIICFIMLSGILPIHAYITTSEGLLPFTDSRNGWYTKAIGFCYVNGIMKGTSPDTFTPQGETTREQMVTVIANISGDEVNGYPQCSFTDVKENAWYTDYVNWAVAKGITSGISETAFGIRKPLTRQETVTLLFNYFMSTHNTFISSDDLSDFSDSESVADWADTAFLWAVTYGVISGDNDRLKPRDNITRAELSQVMRAYTEKITYGDCKHNYTEITCTKASCCTLCGLTAGLPSGHKYEPVSCTDVSSCINCGLVIAPAGHSYVGADCTKPMICSVCNASSGTALGHTTDNGVCSRCNSEVFASAYAKFVYYMNACGMTDKGIKYLEAQVTHSDGNTSTQYVKYNPETGKGSFEIIFDFATNDHTIKTVISFSDIASAYYVESFYSIGGKLQYSGTGSVNAKDSAFTLSTYNGASVYKTQIESLIKSSLLLSLDSSNQILKTYVNMTAADFGFAAFK